MAGNRPLGEVAVDRQRPKERLGFQFRCASTSRFILVLGIDREMHFREFAAAAGGVDQGELGGDLDAASAFGVEAGVENVGADVS
jgi:hypothetical protein